ncbi:beta-N-acetylglucosaminidase (glycoside hydrolase family 20)-like domain protein [Metarhizium robertsii]|uniref:Beta-N-acetylglucosaminidase (Glycoside hydrolase family 20)-like domain protein n=1 Tax=Metarhizium robertsii TaxID=568076 RepID=A0A014QQL0_9HYPO|nr:beta-N-acetylglucosaminidase (glycoside hydrolase family 20)-like domain protein [Metarhizium robertsii]
MCSYMSFVKQNTFQLHLGDQPVLPRYTPDNVRDPALTDKQCGGSLTEQQFGEVFPKFYPFITAQDLERRIPSNDATTFKYDFSKQSSNSVTNLSPNEYHGYTTFTARRFWFLDRPASRPFRQVFGVPSSAAKARPANKLSSWTVAGLASVSPLPWRI